MTVNELIRVYAVRYSIEKSLAAMRSVGKTVAQSAKLGVGGNAFFKRHDDETRVNFGCKKSWFVHIIVSDQLVVGGIVRRLNASRKIV